MAIRIKLKTILLACACVFASAISWAQFDDAPPIKLDQAERQKLQAILDTEIDQGQLNSKKIEQHKQKEIAAATLGDFAAREDRKSTRLNSSHSQQSRMPSSA